MPGNFFDAFDGPERNLEQRKDEAGIDQSGASASSSRASAAKAAVETDILRDTAPDKASKTSAEAREATARAAAEEIKLEKLKALATGRPMGDELSEVSGLLLNVLSSAVEARRLSRDMFGGSGIGHTITSGIGGSPAATMEGLLENIGSNVAFDRLTKMRTDSPTGGALGNVTERELGMLKSSVAAISPTMNDEQFQQGLQRVMEHYLTVYSKIGGDPYALVDVLGPDELPNFADKIQAPRFLPEDEQALSAYVEQSKANGTFDPNDFAAIMSQAYISATGRKPDERYFENAYNTGKKIAAGESADITGISYGKADEDLRKDILERAGATPREKETWGSTLGGAAINFVPSVFELAADTVKGLTVDGNQTLAGLVNVVAGATGLSQDTEAVDALKEYYIDRYGSEEGFQQALKTDPASIVADVAGVLTGGSTLAAKGLTTAGKVGKIASLSNAARKAEGFAAVASKMDPLSMAANMTATAGNRVVAPVARAVGVEGPARLAGVSSSEVTQAFDAGRRKSPEFRDSINGDGDPNAPVSQMEAALAELYQQRSAQYQRRMAKLNKDEQVDFTLVDDAISKVRDVGQHKGIDISGAAKVWNQIEEKVGEFNVPGQQLNTVEDFDAMKRAIFNIRDQYQLGTPEYKVANDVAKSIDQTIRQAAPEYAKIMGEYRIASDVLADVKGSVSAGAASKDTILSKLRKTNAGTGLRGRTILDILESTRSGKGLGDRIAGQALNSNETRGIASAAAVAGSAVTQDPSALAALMLSPRRVGGAAYGLGEKYGTAEALLGRARATAPAQRLEDLSQRYGGAARKGLSVVNPTVIQPQQDPFEFEEQDPEMLKAKLLERYLTPMPEVSLDLGIGGPRLDDYRTREPSVEDLLARYRTP